MREALEAVVAVGEHVHRAGVAHDHTSGGERAGALDPQPIGPGDRAGVGFAAEDERVDPAAVHLGEAVIELRAGLPVQEGRHIPTPSSSARLESQR